MAASYWDICPNTQPSLLGADNFAGLLSEDCEQYLEKYDCVETMGFGNATSGAKPAAFGPGGFPENGTATLSNLDGTIASPVSGTSFVWENGDVPRTIVAAAVDGSAQSQATATSEEAESSSTGTAMSAPTSTTGSGTHMEPQSFLVLFIIGSFVGVAQGSLSRV